MSFALNKCFVRHTTYHTAPGVSKVHYFKLPAKGQANNKTKDIGDHYSHQTPHTQPELRGGRGPLQNTAHIFSQKPQNTVFSYFTGVNLDTLLLSQNSHRRDYGCLRILQKPQKTTKPSGQRVQNNISSFPRCPDEPKQVNSFRERCPRSNPSRPPR